MIDIDLIVQYIKNKMYRTNEIKDDFDIPTDEQIKYIMRDINSMKYK